MRTHITYYW